MEKVVFDHRQDNIYDACSINEEGFKEKVKVYNEKMNDEEATERPSQMVEILCDTFTKEELAVLFVSSQREAGMRRSFESLLSKALTK